MKSSKYLEDSDKSTKRSTKSSSSGRVKKKKSKKENKINRKSEEESVESKELYLSLKYKDNMEKCLSYLESYLNGLNLTDLNNIITEKNLDIFQKLSDVENIQISLLLTKIYNKIFGAEDLYTNFFSDEDEEENETKIGIIFLLIEESLSIFEILEDDVISYEYFELKGNLLKIIKFMKINLKEKLEKEDINILDGYINDLPSKFYSANYLEILKYKSKIYKNNYELLKNIEQIDELFSNLGNYYEQLSAFKLLFSEIEIHNEENNDKNNYISISKKDIKQKKKKKSKKKVESDEEDETDISTKEPKEKITDDEIIYYGQFLTNFGLYNKFLIQPEKKENKKSKKKNEKQKLKKHKKSTEEEEEDEEGEEEEDDEEEEEEEEEEESEEGPKESLEVFLMDAVQNTKSKGKKKSKENTGLSDLINDKILISLMERQNLIEIVKNNILNFYNLTKNSKNKEIKLLKEKFEDFIKSIEEDKTINISPQKINGIKYYNNFTKNIIVVPNRESKVFYLDIKDIKKGLLLIELYVKDEKKDIIFNLNKYDSKVDDFNQIYTSGKLNKKLKLSVYFQGKTLYQLEFNNEYSWINSKNIHYTISLFQIIDDKEALKVKEPINNNQENIINKTDDNNKIDNKEENNNNIENNDNKENEEEEIKEEEIKEKKITPENTKKEKEIKFSCANENGNYVFNCSKICKKISDCEEQEKNNLIQKNTSEISVIISENKIRFISIDENNKIKYTQKTDENDIITSKRFFNKSLYNYLKENYNFEKKENERNKLTINLFCENKNLSQKSQKIRDLISSLETYSINNDDKFQNKIYIQFLEKLGFYPDKIISNYELKYNLYDFTDQCLIYHLYLNHIGKKPIDDNTLVMVFDQEALNITAIKEGVIFNKFTILEKNWNSKFFSNIKANDLKSICNFISSVSNSFDGFDLVLCTVNGEEKKEEYENLFNQIKKFVEENVEEQINVYIYDENEFLAKIIKYIGIFSEE